MVFDFDGLSAGKVVTVASSLQAASRLVFDVGEAATDLSGVFE